MATIGFAWCYFYPIPLVVVLFVPSTFPSSESVQNCTVRVLYFRIFSIVRESKLERYDVP